MCPAAVYSFTSLCSVLSVAASLFSSPFSLLSLRPLCFHCDKWQREDATMSVSKTLISNLGQEFFFLFEIFHVIHWLTAGKRPCNCGTSSTTNPHLNNPPNIKMNDLCNLIYILFTVIYVPERFTITQTVRSLIRFLTARITSFLLWFWSLIEFITALWSSHGGFDWGLL